MQNVKRTHRKGQQGFTLIEIIAVLVILGILAAVAMPKFIDLQGDAAAKAVQGVAGNLSSASAVNWSARTLNSTAAGTSAVANCTDISGLLHGGLPTGYTITAGAVAAGAVNAACVVTHTSSGKTANFTAHGIN